MLGNAAPVIKKDLTTFNKHFEEGYVYSSYGSIKYLKHVISSIITLRRYDKKRPVTIYCSEKHIELLEKYELQDLFSDIIFLPEQYRSILGFKHNIERFMPYKQSLIIDSDIIWCRNPDTLWQSLGAYKFTITGYQVADIFFGGPKGFSVLKDVVMQKRKKTLRHFGLSYLSRVQAGMIYVADKDLTSRVSALAKDFYDRRDETHFISRKNEKGRDVESCEWSLAMAMSALNLQAFPWLNGFESPQIDYIKEYIEHDPDFYNVSCTYYSNKFVYDMKGLKNNVLRKVIIKLLSLLSGKGDVLYVTPYCLHFGWIDQKYIFNEFSDRYWDLLTMK